MGFIDGNKVILDKVSKEDLDIFLGFRNCYDDTKNYRTWCPLTSYNQEEYWKNVVNNSGKHVVFSIKERSSLKLIGECRVSNIDWQKGSGEIGILIGVQYRNKRYAYESLELLIGFAFNRMRLHRLVAECISDNIYSIKLFNNLGFHKDGVMRDSTFYDGGYHNTIIMSLLSTDHR